MPDIVIQGAAGRMGRLCVRAVVQNTGLTLAGAVVKEGDPRAGEDAGELAGIGFIGVPLVTSVADVLAKGRVLVDFSVPAAAVAALKLAAAHGCPAVLGTTGLKAAERDAVEDAGRAVAVVAAPNMAVGVNVVFNLIARAARALGPGFDMEIVELHHRRKKDAPSGTAERMAEILADARKLSPDGITRAREGLVGPRPEGEIGVMALRGGEVIGEHTVLFIGSTERVEITHRAMSRDAFAEGAVRAARWVAVAGRRPGVYSMQDVMEG
ncbi:MAG TPA: 4-hydroxy-tetrahydrodipicolinate reductase [Myxococcota bacterium]|nr:4-hydroxy-tetrahydrodipicolinate reductase [Myxococcota bacterium]